MSIWDIINPKEFLFQWIISYSVLQCIWFSGVQFFSSQTKYVTVMTDYQFKSSNTHFSITVLSKIESRLIPNVILSRRLALDAGSVSLEKMYFDEMRK